MATLAGARRITEDAWVQIGRLQAQNADLLAALRDAERRLNCGVSYGPDMASSLRLCASDALSLCRAAIAKAEGR